MTQLRTCTLLLALSLLSACSNTRLIQQDVGNVMVDTLYQQQSQQQCASGADPYVRLRCQRQAQQQMQQYRKEQEKTGAESAQDKQSYPK